MKRKRYSNYIDPVMQMAETGSGLVATEYYSGSLPGNNGSGKFDWGDFANNLMNSTSGVLTSIFSPSYKYQNQAINSMYEAEKRTNTILWVVIGLVLALGVFLVIRKTK